jgi:hypothetical protein
MGRVARTGENKVECWGYQGKTGGFETHSPLGTELVAGIYCLEAVQDLTHLYNLMVVTAFCSDVKVKLITLVVADVAEPATKDNFIPAFACCCGIPSMK